MPSRRVRSTARQALIEQDRLIQEELVATVRDTTEEGIAHFERITVQWKRKPKFRPVLTVRPSVIKSEIGISGAGALQWIWIDRGTGRRGPKKRAYVILPKDPAGRLKFQTGYAARTAPVAKFNRGPGRSFGPWVSPKVVVHPGIRPRKFTETLFEKRLSPPFKKRIENAIRRGVRRAG